MQGVGDPSELGTATHGLFKSFGVKVVQPTNIKSNKNNMDFMILILKYLKIISFQYLVD